MTTTRPYAIFVFGLIGALLSVMVGTAAARAQSTPGATPVAAEDVITFELPGDEVYPEGVAYDEDENVFYVGSTTDGTIFRGDIESGDVEVFSEGGADERTTAIGMELDDDGRLFVAGGDTGSVWVYDTETDDFLASVENELTPDTFLNDIAIVDGEAYVSDSFNPIVWQVTLTGDDDDDDATEVTGEISQYLDFTGTDFEFQADGFNANGIEVTDDGEYLIVVQSATGLLFRIEVSSGDVTEIDLGGATVPNGDGMAIEGQALYVLQNQQELIVPIAMADDFASGTPIDAVTYEAFNYPTTLELTGDGRALVVNSQFGARNEGTDPELPFTVVSVPVPDPVAILASDGTPVSGDDTGDGTGGDDTDDSDDDDGMDDDVEGTPAG